MPGLTGSKIEVNYLLYIVYSERALKRRFLLRGSKRAVYKYLLAALKWRRLKVTYLKLI